MAEEEGPRPEIDSRSVDCVSSEKTKTNRRKKTVPEEIRRGQSAERSKSSLLRGARAVRRTHQICTRTGTRIHHPPGRKGGRLGGIEGGSVTPWPQKAEENWGGIFMSGGAGVAWLVVVFPQHRIRTDSVTRFCTGRGNRVLKSSVTFG